MQTGSDLLKGMELPQIDYSSIVHNIKPNLPKVEIDAESTFSYQLQQQTNQIIEKSNEQIALLVKQNEQLSNNYQKLEELYKIKIFYPDLPKKSPVKLILISVLSLFIAFS